jgi:LmbE family N-acetylglucosaminyl deacetylase
MMHEFQRALVIASHPDDEVLGCGGTMARLAAQGVAVQSLFLSDGVTARAQVADTALAARRRMGDRAAEVLGTQAPAYLDFPDNRMDSVDLLEIVTAIERQSAQVRPDVVFTHFGGDLNIDHRLCAQAVATAFRPTPGQSVKAIYTFEVPSSTEWSFGVAGADFTPQIFFDIGDHLATKIEAIRCYAEEIRDFPHSRSYEAIEALARWRGASVGVQAAEAFGVLRAVV